MKFTRLSLVALPALLGGCVVAPIGPGYGRVVVPVPPAAVVVPAPPAVVVQPYYDGYYGYGHRRRGWR